MIPLSIGPEPAILETKRNEWGEEYKAALSAGTKPPERYRRDDIKNALREETKGKCAYCESHIEHVSFAHIEHLIPKSVKPELVAAWENLSLACEKCNIYKGDYFSENAPLLNPYEDEVAVAVIFYGPMALYRTDAAMLTISRLRLNRAELLFSRSENLREIFRILELLSGTTENAALQAALIEELRERLVTVAEYTSCSRNFASNEAQKRGFELPDLNDAD